VVFRKGSHTRIELGNSFWVKNGAVASLGAARFSAAMLPVPTYIETQVYRDASAVYYLGKFFRNRVETC
jgi:hypothetical protein